MDNPLQRSGRPRGWVVWCAAFLIAAGLVVSLHAAAPHAGSQRHCAVCVALNAPAAAPETPGAPLPLPPSFPLRPAPVDTAHEDHTARLESGRAPPRTV
jgi:hypothetical protein